jgi:hypothetical protein
MDPEQEAMYEKVQRLYEAGKLQDYCWVDLVINWALKDRTERDWEDVGRCNFCGHDGYTHCGKERPDNWQDIVRKRFTWGFDRADRSEAE